MQKTKLFSFYNIYIFLWLVYYLQPVFFGQTGTVYSQLIILFLIVTSLYYAYYAISHYKMLNYMKGLTAMVVMLTVYGAVFIVSGVSYGRESYIYLLEAFNSLLPIYPFYVFTRKGKLTCNSIRWWTLVFLGVVLVQYYLNGQDTLMEAITKGSDSEEFTNNVGYGFLSIIPLLAFFSKKKIIQYVELAYLMVFLLMSMKRGAILIGVISVVYFLWQTMKSSRRNKMIPLVLSLAVIGFGYFAFQYMLETSDYFMYRLEVTQEGNSSGRDEIYSTFLNHFISESNPFYFLFGNGVDTTLCLYGKLAHNDWLELAIDQGALGIVVYIFYWFNFYKAIRKTRFNKEIHLAITLLFIIYFLKTLFSMSYNGMSIYATVCLGYCLGQLSLHNEDIKRKYKKPLIQYANSNSN